MEERGLRRDGKIPIISVEAENLAEAAQKTILSCYHYGARVETPKHRQGGTLGYDADITIRVADSEAEPTIYSGGIVEDGRGIVQYILEVTHGIHNHWKKDAEHPHRWGYTYNERFVDQIPFLLERINNDWHSKKQSEGKGRITGRDYQFSIWRPGEDIIIEQEDPPCFQRGQFRFLEDSEGNIVMNYLTDWRSRDLLKAWNENNIAQLRLMKLFRNKVSDMLNVEIKLGAYIDHSSSLHLYGAYLDDKSLTPKNLERMQSTPYEKLSYSLEDFLEMTEGKTEADLKRIISAQIVAEDEGHGLNQPEKKLRDLGYNVDNFPYPEDWDSWPSSWDDEPDESKLARVQK